MASLEALKTKAIEDLGRGSTKVKDIIEAKNKALNRLANHNKGKADYPSPQLTPQGDISFPKSKSFQINTPEQVEVRYQQLEADYNQQIRDALEETIQERDIGHMHNLIDEYENKELSQIIENGHESYLLEQEAKEQEQILEQEQSQEQQLEPEQTIEEQLEFDVDQFEANLDDTSPYNDFETNGKDMDIDAPEPPEPSGEYE